MKKTIVSLITCILIATAIINPAQAANLEQAPITPLWDNISQAELILNFPSNYGEVSVAVSQQSGCDKIETCVTIYRYDRGTWVYIASKSKSVAWRKSSDRQSFSLPHGIKSRYPGTLF